MHRCIYQVVRLLKIHPGNLTENRYNIFEVGSVCIDSGADGSAAHVQRFHFLCGNVHAPNASFHGIGICHKLLPQADGNRILHLRPPHFDDAVKGFGFGIKRLLQGNQLLAKPLQQAQRCEFSGGGDHIIGRLPAVHMVVGMHQGIVSLGASQQFNRPIGNHFIGIHIHGGSGTALNRVYHKLVVKLSRCNFIARPDDGIGNAGFQPPGIPIGNGGSLFDTGKTVYKFLMERQAGNREISLCAQGLDSIIGILRDFPVSDRIPLNAPGVFFCHMIPFPFGIESFLV